MTPHEIFPPKNAPVCPACKSVLIPLDEAKYEKLLAMLRITWGDQLKGFECSKQDCRSFVAISPKSPA